MMPCVATVKSGLAVESSESLAGQRWRTSMRALPLSLTCGQSDRKLRHLVTGRRVNYSRTGTWV